MPEKYIMPHPDREQARNESLHADDPVLAMLGVGRQLWEMESGDHFVGRLRSKERDAALVLACEIANQDMDVAEVEKELDRLGDKMAEPWR